MKTNSGESILLRWDWKVAFHGASVGALDGTVDAMVRWNVRVTWARRKEAMVAGGVKSRCLKSVGVEIVEEEWVRLWKSFMNRSSGHCELTEYSHSRAIIEREL